jgi:hypothetical protein
MRIRALVVALASVLALALVPGSALAGTKSLRFNTGFTVYNPCTGGYVNTTGQALATVEIAGPHDITVELNDQETGDGYRMSLKAERSFFNKASYYYLPFTAEYDGPTRFTASGWVRVYVDGNQRPTGASSSVTTVTCDNDDGANVILN